MPISRPSLLASPGAIALYGLWAAAVAVLLIGDRGAGYTALGLGAGTLLVVALGRWTLPPGGDDPPEDLRQVGTKRQLALRGVLTAALLLWCAVYFAAATGHVSAVSRLVDEIYRAPTGLPRGAISPVTTLTLVVIPAIFLFAFGATRRQIGLRWSSGGNVRLALWMAIPVGLWTWRVATGHLPLVGLLAILLENLMLNGLPEEFVFRGVLLSYCRRYLTTDWAMLVQAVLFSLAHYFVTFDEERGRALLIVANVVAENLPIALLFGLMALRSRSIGMSTIIHFALDATGKALR
jgi:membrane protease YdiL (CAAX protease family)